MKSEYEVALKLVQSTGRRTRKVYDLLVLADKAGDARATYALATWYLHGTRFTKRNRIRAVELLRRAAAENIPGALFDLAVSFEKGIVVKKSVRKAFEHYLRAALLGDRQSLYEVGRMYFHGIGITKNRKLAEIWGDCAEHFGITK